VNEDFEKIITTYKDFFNLVQNNKNADFYIKTHKDEFTKINAVCEKEINQMYLITLEDGHSINCADEHCLMDKRGNMILVKDLVPNKRVMTLNGPVSIKSIKKTNDKIAYDISIEYPHWYVNDNYGLIHHNTLFSLVAAKAYLDFYPDAVLLFFDSEFGTTKNYFGQIGIPTDRVLHTPITNIEEFKFDIVAQLEHLKKGDHVFIIIDSIGNLASKKEVEDAANQKSVADMTRARSLKSLFRIITPILILKDLTAIPINHIYQSQDFYPTDIISGGKGPYLSSNAIWIIGRSKEKDGADVAGYNFTIKIEKSRTVVEGSKLPVTVRFDTGIDKYSGLFDLGVEGGFIVSPSMGFYQLVDTDTGEAIGNKMRKKAIMKDETFWTTILSNPKFDDWIQSNFKIGKTFTKKVEENDQEETEEND